MGQVRLSHVDPCLPLPPSSRPPRPVTAEAVAIAYLTLQQGPPQTPPPWLRHLSSTSSERHAVERARAHIGNATLHDECTPASEDFSRTLAPSTVTIHSYWESQFSGVTDNWLTRPAHDGRGVSKTLETHRTPTSSSLLLSGIAWRGWSAAQLRGGAWPAWLTLRAKVSAQQCRQTRQHSLTLTRLLPLVQTSRPIAQQTALNRFAHCVGAHNRTRLAGAKVAHEFASSARSLITSRENVTKYEVQPSKDARKHFASYDDLYQMAEAVLVIKGTTLMRCAKERFQLLAFCSFSFLSTARPEDFLIAEDYNDASYALQYEDLQFFFLLCEDGVARLAVEVTIRNLKCHKENQNEWRKVIFVSREDFPPALDPAVLLFSMAMEDGVLEGISPQHLDGEGLVASDFNAISHRLQLGPVKTSMLEVPVFSKIKGRQASGEPLMADGMRYQFNKSRCLASPTLVAYDFRRHAVLLLNRPDFTSEDARSGFGHTATNQAFFLSPLQDQRDRLWLRISRSSQLHPVASSLCRQCGEADPEVDMSPPFIPSVPDAATQCYLMQSNRAISRAPLGARVMRPDLA